MYQVAYELTAIIIINPDISWNNTIVEIIIFSFKYLCLRNLIAVFKKYLNSTLCHEYLQFQFSLKVTDNNQIVSLREVNFVNIKSSLDLQFD